MEAIDVRDSVVAALYDLGLGNGEAPAERVLFRDGYYAGVCFDFEDTSAVWLVNAAEIKILNNAGELLNIVQLQEAAKRAA